MNFEKYENTLKYPVKPQRICPCGTPFNISANYCYNCGSDISLPYEKDLRVYYGDMANHTKEEYRLYNLFKEDALEEVGLSDHPKKDKAFAFAWEHGHSAGYPAVMVWLEELVDFELM